MIVSYQFKFITNVKVFKTIKNVVIPAAIVVFILLVVFYNNKSVKLSKEIESSYTYDHQMIELEGQFKAPFLARTGNTISMEFEVYNDFAVIQTGNKVINGIRMNYGEGKNSVLINVSGDRKFEQSDVIIFDKDGNKLKTSDKVKITGRIVYPHKDEKKESLVKDYKTGKETIKDEGQDYSYEITDVVVQKY
ncbi:hypothetical protein KRE40_01695 [Elizabethkingia meningoseptica]|uniref:Uncharacterized protein n=1 Tax=Elizabethkingia meningoseptica TaxID=238 RepID=A0A1V3TXN7_ELIME|nr:hypothetical protein BBD35_11770 [Elizabethkingia meningoseptica]MDE5431062.1 hypothetical protein [Elizabethkingia meningoseptica]MDE5433453.1 hypothetical protein [Elizabethkingia meningoseptica]MDE5437540.1 hypothetical protein [Elizabethkingia meningoseptica]MDE5449881.1 hypothetical protein [Elizabethkingia meningoseptica]